MVVNNKINVKANSKLALLNTNINKDQLVSLFKRPIPTETTYKTRLDYELNMISDKKLISYLIQAMKILEITKNMPHVTRGSCGSSLICYLLGISHVDPVKHNIKFARFLNEYRNTLPDIDLDFPHNLRDEVFFKIQTLWPGKVARISNHVYYHEKSALRKAFNNCGINKFIGKNEIMNVLNKTEPKLRKKIIDEKNSLENTFRGYSLHCGGIVFFENGIPDNLIYQNKNSKTVNIFDQITLNKHDIAKDKNFKIDILSSRAVSQLFEINNYQNIDFENCEYDEMTYSMLCKGDNIGITLAESPLIRQTFIKLKPKSIYDLALCLSIIRPAASDNKKIYDINEFSSLNQIIFDDDAIEMIAREFNLSDADSDKYRRAFGKGDRKGINEFKTHIEHLDKKKQKEIMAKLSCLSRYGFCKAHAFSYAQLIYKLAFMKAHKPQEFWKSALSNCKSAYKKWVYLYEAKLAGVNISTFIEDKNVSIYAQNRRCKIKNFDVTEQLRKYGYWIMTDTSFFPKCYYMKIEEVYSFNGIIANMRIVSNGEKKTAFIMVGVKAHVYLQLVIDNFKYMCSNTIGCKGTGNFKNNSDKKCCILTVDKFNFW
jgi:error-prone DNA polymerase